MILALMPLGVEHSRLGQDRNESHYVILALMPLGVEHTKPHRERRKFGFWVILALMPLGVEHTSPRSGSRWRPTVCDPRIDAVRR